MVILHLFTSLLYGGTLVSNNGSSIIIDVLSKTDERTFARSYVLLSQSSSRWNLDDVAQVEDALLEALIFQLEQRWQPLFGEEKAACVQFASEISDGEKRIR
jgi:hypothetical protein